MTLDQAIRLIDPATITEELEKSTTTEASTATK